MYYFGVRYYAAWLGRWTSSDPGGFIDGLNLYRYVRNNPVNLVDPDGMSPDGPPDDDGDPPQKHTIVKNDNLTNIAKKYNTTVENLIEWNNLKGPSMSESGLYPGGELIVSGNNCCNDDKINIISQRLIDNYFDPNQNKNTDWDAIEEEIRNASFFYNFSTEELTFNSDFYARLLKRTQLLHSAHFTLDFLQPNTSYKFFDKLINSASSWDEIRIGQDLMIKYAYDQQQRWDGINATLTAFGIVSIINTAAYGIVMNRLPTATKFSYTPRYKKMEFSTNRDLNRHFDKHNNEFGKGKFKDAYAYQRGAQEVVRGGIKVEYMYRGEPRTGYVRFAGTNSKGHAKFEFVGIRKEITGNKIATYHMKAGKNFWRTLNGSNNDKTITPVK